VFWRWYITLSISGFVDFAHRPEFCILENAAFRKLDLFPSSGEGKETHSPLGPLERANLNHWITGDRSCGAWRNVSSCRAVVEAAKNESSVWFFAAPFLILYKSTEPFRNEQSYDSSVGIASAVCAAGLQVAIRARISSPLRRHSPVTHPASYPMGLLRGKVAGAWISPFTSI
jgi:hypothetical protein